MQQTNNFNQRRKGNLGRQNCSNREHEYIHRPNVVKTCFTCRRYTVKSHAWKISSMLATVYGGGEGGWQGLVHIYTAIVARNFQGPSLTFPSLPRARRWYAVKRSTKVWVKSTSPSMKTYLAVQDRREGNACGKRKNGSLFLGKNLWWQFLLVDVFRKKSWCDKMVFFFSGCYWDLKVIW